MPSKREWTEAEDALVRRIGAPGGPLKSEVARAIGCAAWTVRDRMKAIGHRPETLNRQNVDEGRKDLTRDPLPAGHPVSWDAIVVGTCLEGRSFER
jgi:hypothetical protein